MLPQRPLQPLQPPTAPTTLFSSYLPTNSAWSALPTANADYSSPHYHAQRTPYRNNALSSTAKGIMIGVFSVLAAAAFCLLVATIIYYFRYTSQGRIFLDRITRPGEFDDEQQFAKEEAEALENMDDIQRTEYLRAKGESSHSVIQHPLTASSLCPSKPSRISSDGHFPVTIPRHPRERRLRLGV
jgi:hypothetical protein